MTDGKGKTREPIAEIVAIVLLLIAIYVAAGSPDLLEMRGLLASNQF